jgi:hypothetical protein
MRLEYTKAPIGKVSSLARALSVKKPQLICLSDEADKYFYLLKSLEKPDGTRRNIYAVREPLKTIQQVINSRIIRHVSFPLYLQGSIRDRKNPRGYIADAQLHVSKRLIVRIDIENFFPSVDQNLVHCIWKRFFHFPDHVARILTRLTTYNGFLPQGAPTSPGLANLVFWDMEQSLYEELNRLGFCYSRYVDDITISTNEYTKISQLNSIFSKVFGMFAYKGVSPNRSKTDISTRGHPLKVHGLNVNLDRPTMPAKERSKIRAAVKECEAAFTIDRQDDEYESFWMSTYGRVQCMLSLKCSEASSYKSLLELVRPTR